MTLSLATSWLAAVLLVVFVGIAGLQWRRLFAPNRETRRSHAAFQLVEALVIVVSFSIPLTSSVLFTQVTFTLISSTLAIRFLWPLLKRGKGDRERPRDSSPNGYPGHHAGAQEPMEGMAVIALHRLPSWTWRGSRFKVWIDGTKIGKVANGATTEIPLEPGNYSVRVSVDWCRSPDLEVSVTKGDIVHLECKPVDDQLAQLLRPRRAVVLRFSGASDSQL